MDLTAAEMMLANPRELTAVARTLRRIVYKLSTLEADSGLTRRAIVMMLHDVTRVKKTYIEKLLDCAPLLAERFLNETVQEIEAQEVEEAL